MASDETLWQGVVPGTEETHRVTSCDDSYGSKAHGIEWLREDGEWEGVSYGSEADAPECALVAAHLATLLRETKARADKAEAELRDARLHHGEPAKCPTWYDGCHCTVETLAHNIERAETAERELAQARERADTAMALLSRWVKADERCMVEAALSPADEPSEASQDEYVAAKDAAHKAVKALGGGEPQAGGGGG